MRVKKPTSSKYKTVVVNDKMQKNYQYDLVASMGKDFDPQFQPQLTPKEMLELGIFGGKYMTDCVAEFPTDRFTHTKLSPHKKDKKLNFFWCQCFTFPQRTTRKRTDLRRGS